MADLVSYTLIPVSPNAALGSPEPGQYGWRYTLPEGRTLRLGREPRDCDWAVPEDALLSGWHATLQWNGTALLVSLRPATPEFPKEPRNPIYFQQKTVRDCRVRPGESFVIGQTRFTVRADDASDPSAPVDGTIVQQQEERTRAELGLVAVTDPGILLKALDQLPAALKGAATEPTLFRQLLKVVLGALPRADAAAVVRVPPDCPIGDLRVVVAEQHVRASAGGTGAEFAPSRKLVRRAVCDTRKSCLHVWSTDPSELTRHDGGHVTTVAHSPDATPWAICSPFQDGTPFALYVAGRLPATVRTAPTGPLLEYQRLVEILVGVLEATRRTLRLTRQLAVASEAWPRNLRRHLDDPAKLEELLRTPQERDVTVLFCDLRGYSRLAEARGADLRGAWAEVQQALDIMSSAVTDRGGVVAGFRGDAVLGFWGWPESAPDQIERAAEAALRIHEKLSGPMVQRRCGLGLTHGRALAGRLGAHDLAVVDLYGPVVNLAFRLEEMTKAFGVGIVISDAVVTALRGADASGRRWRIRGLGPVTPRGVETSLSVAELAPARATAGSDSWVLSHAYEVNLPQWDEAVEKFTSGAWAEARDRFDGVFADDPAAQCFLRFMARTQNAPPENWSGTFTPRPKE